MPIPHFTPWDHNFPYGPPPDAEEFLKQCMAGGGSEAACRVEFQEEQDRQCEAAGSIIECLDQTLGERLPVVGTPFTLNYRSDRVEGRAQRRLKIPVSGSTLPASLARIDIRVLVAGQEIKQSLAPAPNLVPTVSWNGKDAYGRNVVGSTPVTVEIGYVYPLVYFEPSEFERAFARFSDSGVPISTNDDRTELVLWNSQEGTLGRSSPASVGLGAWTLDVHHQYDPISRTLLQGDGARRAASAQTPNVINTIAGKDEPSYSGDGGPATEAVIGFVGDVARAPDGSIYLVDPSSGRVRRVAPDGAISRFAGGGKPDDEVGDGGPAREAKLEWPSGIAVGPDGGVYIVDEFQERVRRVAPDGTISTVAGGGLPSDGNGDGGPATEARLVFPNDLAIAPDGTLFISESDRVRRVGPDGVITTVVGGGFCDDVCWETHGDGGPGRQRGHQPGRPGARHRRQHLCHRSARGCVVWVPTGLSARSPAAWTSATPNVRRTTVTAAPRRRRSSSNRRRSPCGPSGDVFIAEGNRIRRVNAAGVISTFAGASDPDGDLGDGGPALEARLFFPEDVVATSDGRLLIADTGNQRVRPVATDGTISTVAGSGEFASTGDGGPPPAHRRDRRTPWPRGRTARCTSATSRAGASTAAFGESVRPGS